MSKLRSPRLDCSTTTGTSAASGSIMRISSFIVERRAENRRAGPVGALHRRQCGAFQGGKIAPVDLGAGKKRRLPVEYKPTPAARPKRKGRERSEEHTSELQSLMRISYAVFCFKKKTT